MTASNQGGVGKSGALTFNTIGQMLLPDNLTVATLKYQ